MANQRHIRRAIYPGTFDPVTNGHISLIERATQLFDRVIVAVSENAEKSPYFSFEQRIAMMKGWAETAECNGVVEVVGFSGLLADFAKKLDVIAIIRGLRALSDFEIEFQMALMNRKLAREIETVFLMPALSWVYLSSTIVKEVACHGGNISDLVPPSVVDQFKQIKQKQ